MSKTRQIAIFGPNLSASGTPAALERGCSLLRALGRLGHRLTFYQPDLFGRRTLWECGQDDGLRLVSYPVHGYVGLFECLEEAATADVIVKTSGAGTFDRLLETAVLEVRKPDGIAVLLDLDADATLNRLRRNPADPLLALIPDYDLVLTRGGLPILGAYKALGARECALLWSDPHQGARGMTAPNPRGPASDEQLRGLEQVFSLCLAERRETDAINPTAQSSHSG